MLGALASGLMCLAGCSSGDAPSPSFPEDASAPIEPVPGVDASTDAAQPPAEDAAPPADSGLADGDAGAPAATFTEVYSEIINGAPNCNECHTAPPSSGNLDMSSQATAYTNLVGQPATSAPKCASETIDLVDPGNAATSLLYLKVTAPPCGSQMPLGGTPLTSAQAELIASWINAGAMNN